MTDQQFQKLMEILGNLGNNAYQAALRQVYVDAWGYVVWGTSFLILSMVFVGLCIWAFKKINAPQDVRNNDDIGPIFIGCGVGVLGTLIASLINYNQAMSLFLSPNWNAIQYLAHLVK